MHYEDVKIKSGDMISKFIENGSESSGGQASTHCCEVAPIANGRLIGNRLKKKPLESVSPSLHHLESHSSQEG